jgi:hypothetical protein
LSHVAPYRSVRPSDQSGGFEEPAQRGVLAGQNPCGTTYLCF